MPKVGRQQKNQTFEGNYFVYCDIQNFSPIFIKKEVDNLTKKEIIKIVVEVAQKYEKMLKNKNLLFVYINRSDQKIKYIEARFLSRNFLHLTGLNFLGKYSNYFYELCLNNKLKSKDIQIKNQTTTQMKLEILGNLASLNKKVKILGDFNASKPKLNTELMIGNIEWCLGLIREGRYYVPNTLCKEDIRNVVKNSNRIICILSKKVKEDFYSTIDYLVKDIEIQNIIQSQDLKDKITIKYDKKPQNWQY